MKLMIKGPLASARRAAQRHGVQVRDCYRSESRGGGVTCTVRCGRGTTRKVTEWFGERTLMTPGRGSPPGTLLFYNGTCPTDLGKRRRRRRKRSR